MIWIVFFYRKTNGLQHRTRTLGSISWIYLGIRWCSIIVETECIYYFIEYSTSSVKRSIARDGRLINDRFMSHSAMLNMNISNQGRTDYDARPLNLLQHTQQRHWTRHGLLQPAPRITLDSKYLHCILHLRCQPTRRDFSFTKLIESIHSVSTIMEHLIPR